MLGAGWKASQIPQPVTMTTPSIANRARESPWPLLPMDAALSTVLSHAQGQRQEQEQHQQQHQPQQAAAATGHVLAQNIDALAPFPPFRASIMDGYAVVSSDGPTGIRRVVGPSSTAGSALRPAFVVLPGTVARITTGAPVPEGADAVVMVEQTALVQTDTENPNEEGLVELRRGPADVIKHGDNVRQIGSDIALGERVLSKGDVLGAAEIGLLAAAGVQTVSVRRKPVVAIVSTGDELVDAHQQASQLGPSQIYDSNRPAIKTALETSGLVGSVVDLGIVNDTVDNLVAAVRRGLELADVLITSGGVSMGETDLLKPTLQALGCTVHFGRVQMKPG